MNNLRLDMGAAGGAAEELSGGTPRDADTHVRPRVYLTGDVPGIGGVIKQRPEDFLVEEIPLYDPCGEGEHLYLFVEKRGLSTFDLVALLANHFQVQRHAIGYAGLKDKAAITRQVMSIHVPGKKLEDFPEIRHERVGVLWADYHKNKLRQGHLKGNRFSIRVRQTEASKVLHATRVLERLKKTGVPNRIGEQRFGHLQNNHLIGRALVIGKYEEALDLLLGPSKDFPSVRPAAREAYARRDFVTAINETARAARAEQAALRCLARGGSAGHAIGSIDDASLRFYISAFQSAIFNHVLDDRVTEGTFSTLKLGDVAFRHEGRVNFLVDEETFAKAETAERARAFEISPSGPMWGASMVRAAGKVDEAELAALADLGVSIGELATFNERRGHLIEGARRPLCVPLIDPETEGGVDELGMYVRCAFELPRGSFATVVLREVMKPDDGVVSGDEEGPGAG